MLSIGKLAAGQASNYVDQAEVPVNAVESIGDGLEEYYTSGAEARGIWVGAGATAHGLSREVDGGRWRLALLHPCRTRSRRSCAVAGLVERSAGSGMTFSAPESVSVVFAVGDPQLRQAVRRAQDVAVREGSRVRAAVRARRTLDLHIPAELDATGIRALAQHIAATLRNSNNSGQPKHLLLAGPASLSALVGAAANANGPVTCRSGRQHLPLGDDLRRLSHETPLLGHERHLVAHIADHFTHLRTLGRVRGRTETRLCAAISGPFGSAYICLKIVVSPVRVRVSPCRNADGIRICFFPVWPAQALRWVPDWVPGPDALRVRGRRPQCSSTFRGQLDTKRPRFPSSSVIADAGNPRATINRAADSTRGSLIPLLLRSTEPRTGLWEHKRGHIRRRGATQTTPYPRPSAGAASPVGLRPGDDAFRLLDDLAVVEDEHRNKALVGQPLDLLATARDVRQRRKAVRLHDVWRVAGFLQRVVGLLARVCVRAPRARPPWPRVGKRSPADGELHAGGCTGGLTDGAGSQPRFASRAKPLWYGFLHPSRS